MTPPHIHNNFDCAVSAGIFPTNTVGEPGAHGATVLGIHGIGVNTPIAAAVAATTVGFAILLHIPKGMILINGLLSIILAIGILLTIVRFIGRTFIGVGAMPNEHCSIAPAQTPGQLMVTPPADATVVALTHRR